MNSREDAAQSKQYSKSSLIRNDSASRESTDDHNETSLHMSHHRTLDGSGSTNDEKLRQVDHCGQETAQEDHPPRIHRGFSQIWKFVRPWDSVEKNDTTKWCLVEQELESVRLVFSLVCTDPDRVDTANEDTDDCNDNAQSVCGLDGCSSHRGGLLVVI